MQIRDFRRIQYMLLALASFGAPFGFAQQANMPVVTVTNVPSQNVDTDWQAKKGKAGAYEVGAADAADVPPELLSSLDISYPKSARKAHQHGICVVKTTVDAEGHPQDIEIERSAGPILDEATTATVRKFRFRPAQKSGKAVATTMTIGAIYSILPKELNQAPQVIIRLETPPPPGVYALQKGGPVVVPKIIYAPAVGIPLELRDLGIAPNCQISVVIDADGHTSDVYPLMKCPGGMEKEILKAAKSYRYQPGTLNGKPVATHTVITQSSIFVR